MANIDRAARDQGADRPLPVLLLGPVLLLALLMGACGVDVPRVPLELVGAPPRLIEQCRDSVRKVRVPQLACTSARPPAQWVVRVDRRARVLMLARYTRVGRGRAAALFDSSRTAMQTRLGDAIPCEVGYGRSWHRSGWTTFVTLQGADPAEGDTIVDVLVAAERGPDVSPC